MASKKTTKKQTKQPKTGGPRRAAIYVRVSSERQADKVSPEAQEADCRALAERQGYTVVAVYSDTEKYRVGKRLVEPSGTRADRPGLRAMLADARAGAFDVMLAWREDRLYRSYRPMLDVLDCLDETGIDIELAKENFDKNLAPVKAWAARMELDAKRDRVVMGTAGRLASGKIPSGGNTPYGYSRAGDSWVRNDAEANWIAQIWQGYGDGMSAGEIRRRLIAGGATQRNGGDLKSPWRVTYIRRILRSDFYYTGVYKTRWNGNVYDILLPAIVDAKTAVKAKARLARYKAYPAGNLTVETWTAGTVYCSACGVKMAVKKASNGRCYMYYACSDYLAGNSGADCAKRAVLHKIDAEVWEKVWAEISDPVKFEARVRAALAERQAQEVDAAAVCKDLESKLDALDFERQKVVTWARKGIIGEDDLGTQLTALTFEEAGLRRELADKRLLVGNRAERFIAVAMDYQARLVKGAQVNFDPQTEKEKQGLFEYKRWVVQGIVKRVDVRADKTTEVKIEFDDKLLEGESLPEDLCISVHPA